MDLNLILTAEPLKLAEGLERSEPAGGVFYVKNVPERSYLAVTGTQWQLLKKFREARTVPAVLEAVIEERTCPPLGEFYELVLKAARARILVPVDHASPFNPAVNWPLSIKPAPVRVALWVLLVVGVGLTMAFKPTLPGTFGEAFLSLAIAAAAGIVGAALSASLLRGGDGEVYAVRRWFLRTADACMLSPANQQSVLVAPVALMATVTTLLAWHRPGWTLFPLVVLLVLTRPFFHGRAGRLLRAHAAQRLSDAEHDFLFPPNRTPRQRWRLLKHGLRSATTWYEIAYGVLWTLVLGYFVGIVTAMPPWTLVFWKVQGPRLAVAFAGSLSLLFLVYASLEFYVFARDRALARHETFTQWKRRWFGRKKVATDESSRSQAVLRSPLLRQLAPPVQGALTKAFKPHFAGPWRKLHGFDEPVSHISLILSGKVGVYRESRSGRRVLVQTLREDDLVGLHAVADPGHPEYLYRTLTPVVLLRVEWSQAAELIVAKTDPATLANFVLKLPFLDRLSLCQNWHRQAVQRFAQLSRIQDFADDEPILREGMYSDHFYVMFEGEARVTRRGKLQGRIRAGDFFGEIGLLQNSNTRAQVAAGDGGARCLCIPRRDFMRFVTHNYTVAMELERVSSERLGRPIFPLTPGNFQTI